MTSDDALDERLRSLFAGCIALVLEDEPEIAGSLAAALSRHGFAEVDVVADGTKAVTHARQKTYDVLILDRQVPGLDGVSTLERVREEGGPSATAPALFLTALGTERQKVEGLAAGGDDYIVKPVSDIELLARVAAVIRRKTQWSAAEPTGPIINGPLLVDRKSMSASLFGNALDLTPREHSILQVLSESTGLPVTRSMLWSRCWSDYNFMPSNSANTIDVHVSRLRKKLDAHSDPLDDQLRPLIIAVRSQGLMLRDLGQLDGAGSDAAPTSPAA